MSGLIARLRQYPLASGFVVVAGLCLLLHAVPVVARIDLGLLDFQFQVLRRLAPEPVERDVVVIGIDEETTKVLREPYTLWHPHFGRAFRALALAEPAVVGVDINFPDRSFDFLIPGYDSELLRGILTLRSVAPLVLGVTVEADGRERRIYPPFLSVAGEGGAGFVLWRLDSDRVARSFSERLGDRGEKVPTLVGMMVRHMGVEPSEGIINFALGERFDYVPMHRVLEWETAGNVEAFRAVFENRAVLLGTVMPFEDRHYQPVNLANWEDNANFAPGVLIHAQALRTIMGPGLIRPFPTVVVLALTLAAAILWWGGGHWAFRLSFGFAWVVMIVVLSTWLLTRGWHLPVAGIAFAGILVFRHI